MKIELIQLASIDGRQQAPGFQADLDPVYAMALIETGFAKPLKKSIETPTPAAGIETADIKPQRKTTRKKAET
jgi:hypothetical protein